MFGARKTGNVLGTEIDVTTLRSTIERVLELAQSRLPAYICFATAHMLVEATRSQPIHDAYAGADSVNPDGTPVAWCLRLLGYSGAECVSGPRTVPLLLKEAAARGISVGFYGGRPGTLVLMQEALLKELPTLAIRYVCSPPFRPLERPSDAKSSRRCLTRSRRRARSCSLSGSARPSRSCGCASGAARCPASAWAWAPRSSSSPGKRNCHRYGCRSSG